MSEEKKSLGVREWENRCQYVMDVSDLARESPRDMVLLYIDGMKAQLESLRGTLVDQYEHEISKDLSLWMETDPLSTVPMYIRGIRRRLLELEYVLPMRKSEIIKMREKWRIENPNWSPR